LTGAGANVESSAILQDEKYLASSARGLSLKLGAIVSLLLVAGVAHAAQEITRPRLSSSVVEWPAALAAVAKIDALGRMSGESDSDVLTRINAASGRYLSGVAASPVPVLLPVDVIALLRDHGKVPDTNQPANGESYFPGYHPPRFFLAGPGGYDATFTIHTGDIPELADISLPDPVEIQIGGMAIYNEIDEPILESRSVPALEAQYPGIRRVIVEGHLRYAFARFGVPYVLSIECFDGRPRLLRLICTQADRIALHFLNALRIAGGAQQRPISVEPPVVVRLQTISPVFTYFGPGRLFPGSGFRGAGGRVDYTVYAPIRFPIAESPAYANSQVYRLRLAKASPREPVAAAEYAYPWRDNFCERRGFTVGQCPGGIGHQGQDIRPAPCRAPLGNDRCDPAHDVVAVRDGAIMRSPKQEAVYIVINTANEHIRFRYLHMEPRRLDEDNVLSARDVREGEVIGQVSNYSQKENGTSYHLHFDVQVPTKNGWVFVSPYMTLVVAYERLINARGTEVYDSPQAAQATEIDSINTPQPASIAPAEKAPKSRRDEPKDASKDQAGVNEPMKSLHE
jgi:Peptidase family M23